MCLFMYTRKAALKSVNLMTWERRCGEGGVWGGGEEGVLLSYCEGGILGKSWSECKLGGVERGAGGRRGRARAEHWSEPRMEARNIGLSKKYKKLR